MFEEQQDLGIQRSLLEISEEKNFSKII